MGENRGAVQQLLHFYMNIEHMHRVRETQKKEHFQLAWENKFDVKQVTYDLYTIFDHLFSVQGKQVVGFKEISFGIDLFEKFENELTSFSDLFQNLKIIFLTRDIEQLLKSGWWTKDEEQSRNTLLNQEENFRAYYQKHSSDKPGALFSITHKDICEKTPRLLEMYSFLGEPFQEEKYEQTLSKITR